MIRPLPPHFLQGAGKIRRPGWAGCFTFGYPVPSQASHFVSRGNVVFLQSFLNKSPAAALRLVLMGEKPELSMTRRHRNITALIFLGGDRSSAGLGYGGPANRRACEPRRFGWKVRHPTIRPRGGAAINRTIGILRICPRSDRKSRALRSGSARSGPAAQLVEGTRPATDGPRHDAGQSSCLSPAVLPVPRSQLQPARR